MAKLGYGENTVEERKTSPCIWLFILHYKSLDFCVHFLCGPQAITSGMLAKTQAIPNSYKYSTLKYMNEFSYNEIHFHSFSEWVFINMPFLRWHMSCSVRICHAMLRSDQVNVGVIQSSVFEPESDSQEEEKLIIHGCKHVDVSQWLCFHILLLDNWINW